MANDCDEPLRAMLLLLGGEYGDATVATAAFELLDPKRRKELLAKLQPAEPEQRFYEITSEDVGKSSIHAWGRKWNVEDLLGFIQKSDVGKRITRGSTVPGQFAGLQVENDVQRDMRQTGERLSQQFAEAGQRMHESMSRFRESVTEAQKKTWRQ